MTDTVQQARSAPKTSWFMADKAIAALAFLIALFCLLPHISVLLASFLGDTDTLRHLAG
ncbi:MAG: iron ABC transporter permease, partial [Octadecabacter sp.]|nr:iron ABC transporter permease [Octadecabacter sp.]